MILSFIYVPLSRAYLGDYLYGVWATISSIVSWISLSDIGIGYGLRNRLTEAIAVDDKEKAQKLISTAYYIMFWICLAVFAVYFIISRIFDIAAFFNISVAGDNTNLALTITFAFMCINFWLGLINQVFYAIQQPAFSTLTGMINQGLNIIFILTVSAFFPVSLPVFAFFLGFGTFLIRIMTSVMVFHKYGYFMPKRGYFDKQYVHAIASIGLALFLGQICNTIMNSTDNVLISKYIDPSKVTPYNTAYKLFNLFVVLQGMIIMPMWSAFTLHKEKREYEWMKQSLKKMNLVTAVLSAGVIIAVFLIPYISDLWLQHHLVYDSLMLWIMAAYVIVYMFYSNYASLLCGVNDIKLYSMLAAAGAVINIPLSIYFASGMELGLAGIILGTLASILPSLLILPFEAKAWFRRMEA